MRAATTQPIRLERTDHNEAILYSNGSNCTTHTAGPIGLHVRLPTKHCFQQCSAFSGLLSGDMLQFSSLG